MSSYRDNPDPKKQLAESVRGSQREKNERLFMELWERHGDGTKPIREFRWHPERKWRADFYFLPRLLIELEGFGGRHHTVKGFHDDCTKYNAAALHGFIVLRFTVKHLKEEPATVAEMITHMKKRIEEKYG